MALKQMQNAVTGEVRLVDDAAPLYAELLKPRAHAIEGEANTPSHWSDIGSPGGGGSSAPTDILLIGADIALLNGWFPPDPINDGYSLPRMYKQGGRVWLSGTVMTPDAPAAILVVPSTHLPDLQGDDPSLFVMCFGPILNAGPRQVTISFVGVDLQIHSPSGAWPGADNPLFLEGISWPLATP